MKKAVHHPEFAKRLELSCDGNKDVPPLNFGRLTWMAQELDKFGVKVTPEAVRKWFAGETRPRGEKAMAALAALLKTDAGWLASGVSPEWTEKERKVMARSENGAAHIVAGLIMVQGGNPAFPQEGDTKASENNIDLYAVIRGAMYSFHVVVAVGEGSSRKFLVAQEAQGVIVLGVVTDGFTVRIFELDWDTILEIGARKGTSFEVPIEHTNWREIKSFAERI